MFGMKGKVAATKAADDFFGHMAKVASATYDQWIATLIDTMTKGLGVDAGWAGRFLEIADSRRDTYALYFAAVLSQEAQGIRVCLDERSGAAVRAALSHNMNSKVESHNGWFPPTVDRYIELQANMRSMMDQPLVSALLTDMGFHAYEETKVLIGHPIWQLPLADALLRLNAQAYWKQFAEKSQIRV